VHRSAATFAATGIHHGTPGGSPAPPGWSGPGAGQQITAYLGAARRSVEFTSEELSDPHVVAALVVGARRRAGCQLVMTASAQWAAVFIAVTRGRLNPAHLPRRPQGALPPRKAF